MSLINDAKTSIVEVACLNTTPNVCLESIGELSPRKKRKLIQSASVSKVGTSSTIADKMENVESSNVESDTSNDAGSINDNVIKSDEVGVNSSEIAAKKTGRLSLRNKKSITQNDVPIHIEAAESKAELLESPTDVKIEQEVSKGSESKINIAANQPWHSIKNKRRLIHSRRMIRNLKPKVNTNPSTSETTPNSLNIPKLNAPNVNIQKNIKVGMKNRHIKHVNLPPVLSDTPLPNIAPEKMDEELLFNTMTESMNDSTQSDIDPRLNMTNEELEAVSVTKVDIDDNDSDMTLPGVEGAFDEPGFLAKDGEATSEECDPPNIGLEPELEDSVPISRMSTLKSSPMLKALIEKSKSPMTRPRTKLPGSWSESSSPVRKSSQKYTNHTMSSDPKGMMVQGTRVEAKDFNGCWYMAKIVEVDQEEMEVLIHYDNWSQRYDEWISMTSPRLRLIDVPVVSPTTEPPYYQVGERCLARWSDNRRFPATIRKVLPNGRYEVVFDDSFVRTLKWPMISKVRSLDSISSSPTNQMAPNVTSPVPYGTRKGATLSAPPDAPPPLPIHNHLFDPSRDHLGSKEERRDMKRRLNVKELFSAKKKRIVGIGQRNRSRVKAGVLKIQKRKIKSEVVEDEKPLIMDIKMEPPIIEPEPPKILIPTEPTISNDQSQAAELLKDEWCCRWVGGQPVGEMSKRVTGPSGNPVTTEDGTSAGLERISVRVEDHRLPPGWIKNLTRRCVGESAGKWDVVLVCPSGRRYRTRAEMRSRFMEADHEQLLPYSHCLMDFSVHRKLSRRLGWDSGEASTPPARKPRTPKVISPVDSVTHVVPKEEALKTEPGITPVSSPAHTAAAKALPLTPAPVPESLSATPLQPLEDGYVYVGSLKVQIIENLLRCPQEGCFKNFRKVNLLQMHIKHYHTELQKFLGDTPNVADLAYARTIVEEVSSPKSRSFDEKPVKKEKKLQMQLLTPKVEFDLENLKQEASERSKNQSPLMLESVNEPSSPARTNIVNLKELETSPKLRNALLESMKVDTPHIKHEPKLKSENIDNSYSSTSHDVFAETPDKSLLIKDSNKKTESSKKKVPTLTIKKGAVSFNQKHLPKIVTNKAPNQNIDAITGTAENIVKKEEVISSPQLNLTPRFNPSVLQNKLKRPSNKRSSGGVPSKKKRPPANNRLDVWEAFTGGDPDETRSSFGPVEQTVPPPMLEDMKPTVEHRIAEPMVPAENSLNDVNTLSGMLNESGEKIKIVHMKREEIINCDCRYGEEDGLMLQCELCLCWQHGICYNIERESQVPEKYICRICQNPLRGRKSQRYLNDQEWLYEGTLPRITPLPNGASPPRYVPLLKKSHELSGNLLQLQGLLHALRCKMDVAEKKDHPKLYLWSKPWEDNTLIMNELKSDHEAKHNKTPLKKIKEEAVEQEEDADIAEEITIDEVKIEDMSQNGITLQDDANDSSMDDGIPKCDNEIELSTSEIPIEECMEMQVVQPNGDQVDMHLPPVAEETIVTTKDDLELMNKVGADGVVSQASATAILANLLLSPGGTPIHLPITNSELETLAKSVQNSAPQPEAAIDPSECRMRLYQHVERTQLLLDARLDSIEAQIAELESQDPSLEDDETAEFYPRTKQTIQMLLRDLATMEELGIISSVSY